MEKEQNQRKVLIIGGRQELVRAVSRLLESDFHLLQAATEPEGWTKAREERPDAIVLGHLEPRGASFKLHNRLRGGWITRHIPQVVVDVHLPGALDGTLAREETMQMAAEDYISVSPRAEAGILPLLQSAGLKEVLGAKLRRKANLLKEAILDPQVFCSTWEQIPGRGAFEIQQEKVFENVLRAAAGGKVHAISVTDNPGGNPALSTEMLCAQIKKANMEPLVHLACRDKNRNEMESMLYGVAAEGVRNILVLSGDYPSAEAFGGTPKPVYDLDPVNALRFVQEMNRGLTQNVAGKATPLARTDFFAGACANPFKTREAELIPQYAKLRKKIQSGAGFLITQIGFDARKLHELLQWLKEYGYDVPVLFNVYVMPYGAAKVMNANGVAGCVVTDELLAEIEREKESADKGKSARLLRAAKQYAIAKGMGCAGAHIGGHGITYDMVESIIDQGEVLSRDWEKFLPEFHYPQEGGFYFFEKDERTGLNTAQPAARSSRGRVPLVYRFARVAHALMFNEKSALFRILRPLAARVDASRRARGAFGWWEHLAKTAMFSCQNCGDCALFDVAYICPMSQCPKQQRNGPCGGSYAGFCEKYPGERDCIWVQAYDRLKAFGEEGKIEDHIVPPCNWQLSDTSSWLNFYLGRDHTAIRLGIAAPVPKVRGKKRDRQEIGGKAPSEKPQ